MGNIDPASGPYAKLFFVTRDGPKCAFADNFSETSPFSTIRKARDSTPLQLQNDTSIVRGQEECRWWEVGKRHSQNERVCRTGTNKMPMRALARPALHYLLHIFIAVFVSTI